MQSPRSSAGCLKARSRACAARGRNPALRSVVHSSRPARGRQDRESGGSSRPSAGRQLGTAVPAPRPRPSPHRPPPRTAAPPGGGAAPLRPDVLLGALRPDPSRWGESFPAAPCTPSPPSRGEAGVCVGSFRRGEGRRRAAGKEYCIAPVRTGNGAPRECRTGRDFSLPPPPSLREKRRSPPTPSTDTAVGEKRAPRT